MGELYFTIARRFNYDYCHAIKDNLKDSGVYEQLVDIQAELNHETIRKYSAYDKPYYFLTPLYGVTKRRVYAVERLATRVAESGAYTRMQELIYCLTGRNKA